MSERQRSTQTVPPRQSVPVQSGDVPNTEQIFSSINSKTVFTEGALFKGRPYEIEGEGRSDMVALYMEENIGNRVLQIVLFNACVKHGTTESKQLGQDVLRRLLPSFHQNTRLTSAAIDMPMKFGVGKRAKQLFSSTKKKTVTSYGVMMQGLLSTR